MAELGGYETWNLGLNGAVDDAGLELVVAAGDGGDDGVGSKVVEGLQERIGGEIGRMETRRDVVVRSLLHRC